MKFTCAECPYTGDTQQAAIQHAADNPGHPLTGELPNGTTARVQAVTLPDFHGQDNENGWSVTAPDLSVTLTDKEGMKALEIFDRIDWDGFEAKLPPGATDTDGNPIDRNNHHIRVMLLSEALTDARGADEGTGLRQLDNPHWELLVETLLEVHDEMTAKYGKAGQN